MLNIVNPNELQRQAELALLLEATIPKRQCTSRYVDVGPKQRFEDFAISAINCGRYFFELGERINRECGQPAQFYDLAYQALVGSSRQRSGKIVSHGLLEVLFPVVVSQCTRASDPYAALDSVPEVLKSTSENDVKSVAAMRKLVYSASDKQFKREFPFHEEGKNVFDHYSHHKTVAHDASRLFVSELCEGMPLTKLVYSHMALEIGDLQERVNAGFDEARSFSKLPAGAIADFTAAALFLLIACNPDKKVF
jgi:hypothetical protein